MTETASPFNTDAPFIEVPVLTRELHAAVQRTPWDRTTVNVYASGIGDLLQVREAKYGKSAPSGCLRKLYLPFFPEQAPPLPETPESSLNFEVGNAFHDFVAKKLDERGVLVRAEFPLKKFHPHISGRSDWLVMNPGVGIGIADGKSMSKWAFDNLTGPKPGDMAQVMFYADLYGLEWCCLFYYAKENGRTREFWFRKSPEVVAAIHREAAGFVAKVQLDRASGTFDPPPMPEGVKPGAWPCSWGREGATCKFYAYCHGQPESAGDEADALTLGGTEPEKPKKRAKLKGGDGA